MHERVIIAFDVTWEEANAIAERIAGVGPHFAAWNLPVALEELADMAPRPGEVPHVALRSEASSALGGPEKIEGMFPRQP